MAGFGLFNCINRARDAASATWNRFTNLSKPEQAMVIQSGWNILVGTLVLMTLIKDWEKLSKTKYGVLEYGYDILVHYMQALLRLNSPTWFKKAMFMANSVSILSTFELSLMNLSNVPLLLRRVDISFNHTVNLLATGASMMWQSTPTSSTSSSAMRPGMAAGKAD